MPCDSIRLSRRAFVRGGTLLLLTAGCIEPAAVVEESSRKKVSIGLLTDLHYADKEHVKTRYYRETLAKLPEAVGQFAEENTDFIVELGDFIDSVDVVKDDLRHLRTVNETLAAAPGEKHYVLGNHCVETLTKNEFLAVVGKTEPHYSFDFGRFHFVVLDACYRADGTPYGRNNFDWTDSNLPAAELEWLRADLESTDKKTIVFAHQRLDDVKRYSVKNAAGVRKVLEQSGKVQAVFQGHHHRNDYQEIAGIHYCTLAAMIEGTGQANSSYSILELQDNDVMRLTGFRKQSSYEWE